MKISLVLLSLIGVNSAYAQEAPSLPPPTIDTKAYEINMQKASLDRLNACEKITIASDRLSCFDDASANAVVDKKMVVPSSKESAWQIKENKYSYLIGTVAYHMNDNNNLYSKLNSSLFLRCENRKINFYISFSEKLFPQKAKVDFKILSKDGVISHETWNASESGAAIGVWDTNKAYSIFTTYLSNDSLNVEVNTVDNRKVVASFDMNGASDLLHDFKEKCNNMSY